MTFALVVIVMSVGGALLLDALKGRALAAALLYVGLNFLLWFGLFEALGRIKPLLLEWRPVRELDVEVVGMHLDEPNAINVWLLLPGESAPRAYALPWSTKAAEKAQDAQREAEANGTSMRMRFEPTWDDRAPMLYAAPQEALPPKAAP